MVERLFSGGLRPSERSVSHALIRFDTTNPPGDEGACIRYVADLLTRAGIDAKILAEDPERPNVVARLPGSGVAAPLLLHGHADVASTAGQEWRHPPFEGVVEGGQVWGRGALDMKGGVAMLLAAFLRVKLEGTPLPGDVILALVADEEAGGDRGRGTWSSGIRGSSRTCATP